MIKLNLFLTNVDRLNLSFGFVGVGFLLSDMITYHNGKTQGPWGTIPQTVDT